MRFGPALVLIGVALTACSGPAGDPLIATAQSVAPAETPPAPATADQSPPRETVPRETVTVETPLDVEIAAEQAAPEPAPEQTPAIALKYLIGDVTPASDSAFARIPEKYLGGSRVWGHAEAVDALTRMGDAAAADGVTLKAVSAFRSFADQKRIWDNKWNGTTRVDGGRLPDTHPDPKTRALKILEQSSMPATSRHHWGTDFDLNALNNSHFASGDGRRVYDWLQANAASFGFCQVYSAKGAERPTGYEEEKWHWSYMPVASRYLAAYPNVVGYDHIKGFEGAASARDIDVIANYVQGINPACR